MYFITPLAFALVALLPIIIALYFLKLRRTEQRVSSTYLWRTLVRDTAANAPWQRLKPNLLLLLQLLFLIALILALARPFTWSRAVAGSHLILVVDTSASMAATDVAPNRLAYAAAQARQLIENLSPSARVTVIDAGAVVRVPVSGAIERGAAFAALDALRPGLSGTDLTSALTLAGAVAASEPDAEIVILSDGGATLAENLPASLAQPARIRFIPIGHARDNQAIGAFSLQTSASGQTLTAFLQIVNYGDRAVTRRLILRDSSGQPITVRDLELAAQQAQPLTLFALPATADAFEAQLEGTDSLALDDRAWAVVPPREKTRVRLLTTGNRFLETALAHLPNVESQTSNVQTFERSNVQTFKRETSLTILDAIVPTSTLPAGNLLFIAPPQATELFSVTGKLEAPLPIAVAADDPVLRYVDVREVAIQDAVRIKLPPWGRAVWIDRATGAPLLIVGEEQGRRLAILAFDVRHSDLPLRVAFPILIANLLDALVPGGAAGVPPNVSPARPFTLAVPPETNSVIVRAPDGTNYTLTPNQGRIIFEQTQQLGVYELVAQDGAGVASPLGRFAVNLFNPQESDIAPRANLALSGSAGTGAMELPRARDEWWQPLAWLALMVLVVEWLVAYRGQVARVVKETLERSNVQTFKRSNVLTFLHPSALFALLLLIPLLALPFVGRAAAARTRQFWLGLIVRALVFAGLILGLAGAQWVQAVHETTVVFVVDHSDSVPAAEQKRAEEFIRAALKTMRPGDRAAIVVFGENVLIERLASQENTLAPITSLPRRTRTNLAAALRLALALLPEETNKRIVILSDGLENAGRAQELVELAAARGVQIDFVPLNPLTGEVEVILDTLKAPASVRQGQQFEIMAHITSTAPGEATLRLFGDGKLLETRTVTLQQGTTRVAFTVTAKDAGFRRYTAELEAAADTLHQNNTAAAFTLVQGPPRVLIVAARDADAANLASALEAAKIVVERVAPSALPGELAALANYDAVFLVNVPAQSLPPAAMQNLPAYVRDLGRGLVMIGGENSFGAGGYLRTLLEKALPVDMDVRARAREPNLAIAFVIDKSGSMGQCHCNNPNAAPGTYPQTASGLSKVELAKDAVMQASRAIGQADYVGVVLFDANAHWALTLQPLPDPDVVQEKIGGAQARGGTNIIAGLSAAVEAIKAVPAKFKHIVLLSDGWSHSGQYDALIEEMKREHITLSVVAAGEGSAPYLEQLARATEGRYFAARTMSEVPALFFQETVRATGSYIVEETFQPLPASTTPILNGLDVTRLPALRGYNGTTPKATARVSLLTARGDPLLATWQFGLGRAAVWTSDLKGQWAREWVTWDQFNAFATQLTNWVLPQPNDTGLQVSFEAEGELQVISHDAQGRPRDLLETQAQIVNPDGTTRTLTLNQSAPDVYRAPFDASQPGIYLAQITQRDASGNPIAGTTGGWVVPYSPEYTFVNQTAGVLPALARATHGRELADPAQVFEPFAAPARRTLPIWQWLLLAAALLFPLDVAARRLRLSQSDWQRMRNWLRVPASRTRPVAHEPRVLEGLFAARERARVAKQVRGSNAKRSDVQTFKRSNVQTFKRETSNVESHASSEEAEELTARLKRARERARQTR